MLEKSNISKYFFLFLIALLILPAFKIYQNYKEQIIINKLVEKASYPEIKGKKPIFKFDIKTSHSITHVLSYIPSEVLSKEDFDEEAAEKVTENVEQIARERRVYQFNPYAEEGFDVSVKLVPAWNENAEHFVFLISKNEPIPAILQKTKDDYPLLSDSLKEGDTFFWTQPLKNGSVSFLRFAEPNTWKNGIPMVDNKALSTHQQLNLGFNIEIWKRATTMHVLSDEKSPKNFQISYISSESLWNTFGRLMVAAQQKKSTPEFLIKSTFDKRILSLKRNVAYYPYDSIAQSIYKNAPDSPILK